MSKKMKKRPAYAKPADINTASGTKSPSKVTVRKRKKQLKPSAIIAIIVAVVVVGGIVAWIGKGAGWYPEKEVAIGGKYTLAEYDPLEIDEAMVSSADLMVESMLSGIQTQYSTSTEITEGTVEDGDTVKIDYIGTYADTGVAFEGGTAEDQQLTIGSGSYIEGFEEGLVGVNVGDTKVLNLTFPEDYQSEELAGKNVNFEVTVKAKVETELPELTDEMVKEYSTENMDQVCNTVDELKAYLSDMYTDSYLESAIDAAMTDKLTVEEYDADAQALVTELLTSSLEAEATQNGVDKETLAKNYGYEDAASYIDQQVQDCLNMMTWSDQVIRDRGIKWTGAQFDSALIEYMKSAGYDSNITLSEFKAQAGEDWIYFYKNLEFKHRLAMDELKTLVSYVKTQEETSGDAAEQGVEETIAETETTE